MRTAFEVGRLAGIGFGIATLAACNATISSNGGNEQPPISGAAGGTSPAGGAATAPQDVPAQPVGALTCSTRYAPDGRIWRLSPEQYRASMADAFGADIDITAMPRDGINQYTGFSTGSADNYVTVGYADVAWDAGKLAAVTAAPGLVAKLPCLNATPDPACVTAAVQQVTSRSFRRPPDDTETARYVAFFQAQAKDNGPAVALRMLLQAVANAPELLYRTELGAGDKGNVALSGHEVASELSYMLTDAPPNTALRAAADAGKLAGHAVVQGFAKDLLATPAARKKADQFVSQYLQLGGIDAKVSDALLAEAMTASVQEFFGELALQSRGTFTELMTAPTAYANATLAPFLGVVATGNQLTRVALDPAQRGGLLTQLAFLAAKSGPIHRGRLIKEGFFCGEIPAPPPGASLQKDRLAGPDADATEQQRWQQFKDQQACGGCHATFQPLGIALDHYDEMGRYRAANAAGRAIDAGGAVVGTGDADGAFTDALALGKRIAGSATGQYCFAKRYMSFAFGRDVSTGRDACAIKAVGDHMVESGLVLSELLVGMTQDDSFYARNNVE